MSDKTVTQVGDHLQSEASRLAEWVLGQVPAVPYEVHMAALGVVGAVDDWTEVRRGARV